MSHPPAPTAENDLPRVHRKSEDHFAPEDLADLDVFQGVCIESVWGLLACCGVRTLEKGVVLLEAGQPNQTMYMILEGRLSVHLASPATEPVAFLESGQTVGEISVIDGSPTSAYVVAAASTRLLAVDEEEVWRLVTGSHQFASNMLVLLARRLRANNTSLCESAELRRRFEREATVDGLTGLLNRRWLDNRLPRLVLRYGRSGERLSVLMIDIDHFKRFNDDHGHLSGDLVLAAVARTIQQGVRPTDLAVRYGGEEMFVALPHTPLDGARHAAERLREMVAALEVEGTEKQALPGVTISLGVACLEPNDTVESLMQRADTALYQAKDKGRNRVEG